MTYSVAYPGVPCHQAPYAIQDSSPTTPVVTLLAGPMAHARYTSLAIACE